ncbi:hypothetical protein FRC20_008466 [Serendipita sp. 405]|nr:hypothetical protein FRC20_008466 [Serendipita sp. 405]
MIILARSIFSAIGFACLDPQIFKLAPFERYRHPREPSTRAGKHLDAPVRISSPMTPLGLLVMASDTEKEQC